MHIALVLSYAGERFGGPVCVAKNMVAALSALGHVVSCWAPGETDDLREPALVNSPHICRLAWPRAWRRSPDLARALSAKVASIDVIHVSEFWPYPVYAASRVAVASRTPYVLRPAGNLEPWSLRSTLPKRLKKTLYLKLIGKSVLQSAACLQAASPKEAEHFRQVGYGGPTAVIPNGVDTVEFSPGDMYEAETYFADLKDRLVVLFMSRLSPEKGLNLLIPAWADVVGCRAFREALLVIAGPDCRGYKRTLEGMINKHDLRSRVLLTGLVRGETKIALYRRADVFILPSHSESFGVVVAEALSCETPVITTTATPWQELTDADAGRCVPTRKEALTRALRELLSMSHERRRAMGCRGRDLVLQNYTWSIVARKMITIYRHILQGRDIPLYPEPAEAVGLC